jgi:phage FluMu gp28-like protein
MPRISKETMRAEIRRCGQDPSYFLKNYVKITHKEKGLIPFTTFDYQDDLLRDFKDHKFNIILKSRQLGISTIVAGYAAWMMLFRREKQIMAVATKLKTAANIVIKVKKMIKTLPEWLIISDVVTDNQATFELTNGSKITASTTSAKDAGRSEALSLLIIDEAAHVEGMDDMWTSIAPTITGGGSCVALSSPAGVGGWFYKTFVAAEAGENLFNPITLPWGVHPERDHEWFRNETKNMSKREIAQEYECSFNMLRVKQWCRQKI